MGAGARMRLGCGDVCSCHYGWAPGRAEVGAGVRLPVVEAPMQPDLKAPRTVLPGL